MLAIFFGILLLLPQQGSLAVLEGTVVDAVTGQPLPGAQVRIAEGTSGPPDFTQQPFQQVLTRPSDPEVRTILSVATDPSGRFTFKYLPAGLYTLAAAAEGHVYQVYGQRVAFGVPTPLNIVVGAKNSAEVRLNPAAMVTGTISDETRRPLSGITVCLLVPEFWADGTRRYRVKEEATTDATGRYFLTGIGAGRYYLVAGIDQTPASRALRAQSAQPYSWTYYPGVTEGGLAAQVDAMAGAQMDLSNLSLVKEEPRTVKGRVIDSRTGKPPQSANVSLTGNYPFIQTGSFSAPRQTGTYDPASGAFEFTNVSVGSYRIDVVLPQPPQPRPTTPTLDDLSTTARDAFAIVNVSK